MNAIRRPRIGISTYREQASWGIWQREADLLPTTYADCVAAAGGIALLLPPTAEASAELAADTVAGLDGLVISGGPDVDPARYDEPAHVETDRPRMHRDSWELALLAAALERDVPVLAICRGAQLLNVAYGGSLIQHLPEQPEVDEHRGGVAVFGTTHVALDPAALPGSIVGESVDVSCYHHQAIGHLGSGLTVTGRAPDGMIEAVVVEGRAFAVGVQWHPEQDHELRLFTALIEAADRVGQSKKEPAYP
jgi:gamma-glutamyl-gamma-aminobutyrate hydrolase PuuD